MKAASRSYRLNFWQQQPERVEVWSEKGTVRGLLQLVLDEYAIGFSVMHGFGSATALNDVCEGDDADHPLIILYVGDYEPSGLYMSERDIPERLEKYGGDNITIERIALLRTDCDLLGRQASLQREGRSSKDPRAPWFRRTYGQLCWELDAMDPNRSARSCRGRNQRTSIRLLGSAARMSTRQSARSMSEFFSKWKL